MVPEQKDNNESKSWIYTVDLGEGWGMKGEKKTASGDFVLFVVKDWIN